MRIVKSTTVKVYGDIQKYHKMLTEKNIQFSYEKYFDDIHGIVDTFLNIHISEDQYQNLYEILKDHEGYIESETEISRYINGAWE